MPLIAVLDSLEGLPDSLHDEYEEGEDGKFHLKILQNYVPKDKVEDTRGLKSALQKEREARAAAERQRKALEEKYSGIDVEEWEKIQKEREEAAEREAEKKGEWERLKQQMREQHQQELDKRNAEANRLKTMLEKHLIDAQAVSAINELQGNVTLLLPHVKSRIRLVEKDDGEYQAVVVETDGKTPRVNAEGDPFSIKDLVSEMRNQETFAAGFKGTGAAGGGAPPDGGSERPPGGKPPVGGKSRSQMTPKEKAEFITAHGLDEFMKLPW